MSILEFLKEKKHIEIPTHEFLYKTVTDRNLIDKHCVCKEEFKDFSDKLIDILVESECILDGHFELLSGKHSRYFLRFSKIARYVHLYKPIAQRLVSAIRERDIEFDALLSPDTAGSALAYGIREEYVDKCIQLIISKTDKYKSPTGEINFLDVLPDTGVVIVNDLTSTGEGVKKLLELAKKKKCIVKGVVLFANRNPANTNIKEVITNTISHDVPLIVMCDINFPDVWDKKEKDCPLCPGHVIYSYFLN